MLNFAQTNPCINPCLIPCCIPCTKMDDPPMMPFGSFGMMPSGFDGQHFFHHHFHHHFHHFPFGFGGSPFGFGGFGGSPFGF